MGHKYEANTWGEHRLRRASDLGEVHLEGGLWAPRRGGRSGWWPAPLEGARPVGQRPLPPPGGYPLEEGLPEPSAPAKMCRWSKVPEAVWDKSQVLANIHSKQALHLDARPVGRFHGEQPEPRPKLRWGHVPGSVSLEAVALLKLPYMLNQKDLQLVVEGAGIKLEHLRGDIGPRILTSCGSGMTACILGLGLHQLGMPLSRWSVYDASWCEWGADQDTPGIGSTVLHEEKNTTGREHKGYTKGYICVSQMLDPNPLQGSDPNPLEGSGPEPIPYGFEGPRAVWSVWDRCINVGCSSPSTV
ncbi:Thiosulfate/3-mercaptopyruvate sulfurtransferase 1 [Durusdinium trenchii]|uniref:Mitochondrial (AtMST1) (Rhodanese homolog protein 1) (AtRDH1) (Sulfurtransferase 1) (AtStr1) n=1 Tax=Durusdinium trenchii TaxID=1381693 RepID=A0ABP0LZ29_9DINO